MTPIKIFFCYAREDEALLDKLKAHLRPLQREGQIDMWYDREIHAGSDWEQEIKRHLDDAQIILLLISPAFMNSDYCYSVEMQRALRRHERGDAKVIPIILRPALWRTKALRGLQALPKDGKPVIGAGWRSQDEALNSIGLGIYEVLSRLSLKRASSLSDMEGIMEYITSRSNFVSFPLAAHPLAVDTLKLSYTFTAHTSRVSDIAIGLDGKTLISKDRSTIKIWELDTGREVRTLTDNINYAAGIAISPDGKVLASGYGDYSIKMWELDTGREVRILTSHGDRVASLAISSDNRTLCSGSRNSMIKIWELDTGREVRTLTGHGDGVASLAISSDNRTLCSGSRDSMIKVWELDTGREVGTLISHENAITSVALSSDGKNLVSGSWDNTIKIWELDTGREPHTLTGHTKAVRCIAINSDGKTLVSGSSDHTIKIWELTTDRILRTLINPKGAVSSIALGSDGKTLACGSPDGTISVWKA